MKPVLLDTVGLIAIWDEADQWHAVATPVFDALQSERRSMLTTTCVMLECGNAAARRPYRQEVDVLRRKMLARNRLIEPTPDDAEQAWNDYHAGFGGNAGIVDCISFVVMHRLGLVEAFTHNAHFKAAGFTTLF